MITVAINGFGRIGRAALKIAVEREGLQIVAINDLGNTENLAYLLQHDSIYGRYSQAVKVMGDMLQIDDRQITVLHEKDPAKLPWKKMGIDVVIESTGIFTEEAKARAHLVAGAKQVVISAPSKDAVPTIVAGVNPTSPSGLRGASSIVSTASCTTNCAATMMGVMAAAFPVERAMLTTVHAYTATQSLVDGPATKDYRRGRAAALNIVPSSTGASEAITRTLPQLEGAVTGLSLRVPVATVSISDVTFLLKKEASVEAVNEAFRAAAAKPEFQNILAVTDEPVVSSDFIGDPHSAIVDLGLTQVTGNLVKVLAWYDNEWGYANRLIDQVAAYTG